MSDNNTKTPCISCIHYKMCKYVDSIFNYESKMPAINHDELSFISFEIRCSHYQMNDIIEIKAEKGLKDYSHMFKVTGPETKEI